MKWQNLSGVFRFKESNKDWYGSFISVGLILMCSQHGGKKYLVLGIPISWWNSTVLLYKKHSPWHSLYLILTYSNLHSHKIHSLLHCSLILSPILFILLRFCKNPSTYLHKTNCTISLSSHFDIYYNLQYLLNLNKNITFNSVKCSKINTLIQIFCSKISNLSKLLNPFFIL